MCPHLHGRGAGAEHLADLLKGHLLEPVQLDDLALPGRAPANGAAHLEGARVSRQAAAARVWLLAQIGRWMERFGVAA